MEDKALIVRVLASNDGHAFTTLVRKHQHAIRHFLRRLASGDHAMAEDLAQETFLCAYQKLSSFRAEASFATWLHTIAYRLFLRQAQKAYHFYEETSVDLNLLRATEQAVERDILLERLMGWLSIEERTCLTLSYSAGMSHDEIVTVTNLPLGTVKSHILRAKQKLVRLTSKTPLLAGTGNEPE